MFQSHLSKGCHIDVWNEYLNIVSWFLCSENNSHTLVQEPGWDIFYKRVKTIIWIILYYKTESGITLVYIDSKPRACKYIWSYITLLFCGWLSQHVDSLLSSDLNKVELNTRCSYLCCMDVSMVCNHLIVRRNT